MPDFIYRIAKTDREDKIFKKRYLWFMAYYFFMVLVAWGYGSFALAFIYIPNDYQWLLGLISPFARIFGVFVLNEISKNASGLEETNLSSQHYMESRHALFMAIIIGSVATPLTLYLVIGLDFLINIYNCLYVVMMIKKNGKSEGDDEGTYKIFSQFASF